MVGIEIEKAGKDELAAYAQEYLALDLDLSKPLSKLRAEVQAASNKTSSAERMGPRQPPEFLRHPRTGRVFEATPLLLARTDLLPCDADGKDL